MSQTLICTSAIVAMTFLFAGSSLADVPPEPGFVESCTVANHAKDGLACLSCGAWHGDRDACVKSLGTQGFTKKCQTRGASTWNEVWCKPGEATPLKPAEDTPVKPAEDNPAETPEADKPAAPPVKEATKKKSNCSGGEPPVGWVALSVLGLLVFRRRCDATTST